MSQIPKIIHQIWSGIDKPLPEFFRMLGETWKRDYPDWEYIQWDNPKMEAFIKEHYPQHWDVYSRYPYNVQRWDAVRYLILGKIGGLYADFDYESIEPMEGLFEEKSCCFALEPQSHCFLFRKLRMFNNALMISVPGHPFMKHIINKVFDPEMLNYKKENKNLCVMNTTGPWMLMDLYNALSDEEKEGVYLLPAKYVSPFDGWQASRAKYGDKEIDLEEALEEAYAVHYYFSEWRKNNT